MHCYECTKHGVPTPAVALCRSCFAGLCPEHLREAADRFAADGHQPWGIMSRACHHDTWAAHGADPAAPPDRRR